MSTAFGQHLNQAGLKLQARRPKTVHETPVSGPHLDVNNDWIWSSLIFNHYIFFHIVSLILWSFGPIGVKLAKYMLATLQNKKLETLDSTRQNNPNQTKIVFSFQLFIPY